MLLTTIGTDLGAKRGRTNSLSLLFSLYAFAVWGYITASIASCFIGQDQGS
jgi:voltage-gated potassium channel